jgi:DNA-binding transcriptional ArsR family regulator
MEDDGTFIKQLKVLASDASVKIIRVLSEYKPNPVPVRVISAELGMKQQATSAHLARLRKVHLIAPGGNRRKGYLADTGEIKAVIGPQGYKRITRELGTINEDTPG